MRGDGALKQGGLVAGQGSPPRARGRLAAELLDAVVHGLTPACAGTALVDKERHRTPDRRYFTLWHGGVDWLGSTLGAWWLGAHVLLVGGSA